jgi:hypothetical protein
MKALCAACLLIVLGPTGRPYASVQIERRIKQATLPDLVVTGAVLVNAEKGEFNVVVRNRGLGGAARCHLRLTITDQYGKQILKIAYIEQPAIRPEQTLRLSIRAQISLSGQRYIIATDALDAVRESSERNNLYKGKVSKY